MGPLFACPILLVEGDDDYRIWSQVPRHNILKVAVIPCNGDQIKQYQKTLEKILACLLPSSSKPSGYALIDGDKPLPRQSSTPQVFVKFIRLSCHESENLYICDEILSDVETDWIRARELIKSNSSEAGAKKPILDTVDDWDRKTCDIKEVIEEIARIIDPKHVHWTLRVGKHLGKHYPEGQIAEFLGQSVIEELWGSALTINEENET